MKSLAIMMITVGLMLVAGCAREQRGLPRLRGPEHTVAPREEPKRSGLGKVLFEHQWQANDSLSGGDGLGPVFNARACSDCHSQGGVGGSGPGERNVLTFEVHPNPGEPHGQSGVVHTFAIDRSCQENEEVLRRRYPPLNVGARADDGAYETTEHFDPLQLASVNTPALFGAGLIERISTQAIQDNRMRRLLARAAREFESRFDSIPVGRVRVLPDGRVGKFGWRAQVATLREFVARACATELGLGNPLMEQDRPLGKPDYPSVKRDLDAEQFAALVAFVDTLPRPRETLPTDVNTRAQAVRGKQLFGAIGCATCHTPDLGGLQGVYSDFLLYVLEPPGSSEEGLYQDTAQELPPGVLPLPEGHALPEEWKTPPLWGVADSAPYFHDGKSPTLADAILRHGGDAASVTRAYQRLSHEKQEAIIVFLKTLRAPVETEGAGGPDFADGRDGALSEIRKLGGAIELGENSPAKPVVRLNLTGKLVSDIDLVHLRGLAQLHALELSQTQVTDAGLARLKGLTKLRQLDLGINVLTDAGLAHLRGLSQLRALNLRFTLISDAGLAHLRDLPQLQVLKLDGTEVTAEGLKHLRELTRLQELDLSATKVTDAGLVHLQGLTELRELVLTSTRVGDSGLRHLKGLTELQRLGLNSTRMGDAGLDHVRGLLNLQRLELEGCMVTDSGLARLEGLTDLRELNINHTLVTDAGMRHVGRLSNLRALRLFNARLTDAGLSHLRRLTRLQTLDLRGTEVSDKGLRYLKELTHLQELYLWRTRVTEGGAKNLQREMPNVTIRR
jgi:CxxC motif-containing protein (DUF1111 family)